MSTTWKTTKRKRVYNNRGKREEIVIIEVTSFVPHPGHTFLGCKNKVFGHVCVKIHLSSEWEAREVNIPVAYSKTAWMDALAYSNVETRYHNQIHETIKSFVQTNQLLSKFNYT